MHAGDDAMAWGFLLAHVIAFSLFIVLWVATQFKASKDYLGYITLVWVLVVFLVLRRLPMPSEDWWAKREHSQAQSRGQISEV